MPSFLHEAFILLFRNQPELAAELLRATGLLTVPPFSSARLESIDFSEIAPAEYRVDLVIVLKRRGKPIYCLLVEVQLARNPRKRETWPFYQASARARFRCPTAVLVVTPSAAVARWASRPIDIGGGYVWAPLVIGAEGVPVVDDPSVARKYPELGVLSVMAHGRGEPAQALRIAGAAISGLDVVRDDDDRVLYFDLVQSHLGEATRKALAMIPEGYQFQSKLLRQNYAEGQAEGRREGEAKALLAVLQARGLAVTAQQRQRILACTDLAMLEDWIRRAVTVASVDDLIS